jgi:AbrB family looped-hinge helix DNA binding protein
MAKETGVSLRFVKRKEYSDDEIPPMTVGVWKVTVTSKGQVTLPAKLRRHLGIDEGSVVIFQLWDDGTAEFRRATTIEDWAAMEPLTPFPEFEGKTWDEIREIVWAKEMAEQERRLAAQWEPPPSSTPTSS